MALYIIEGLLNRGSIPYISKGRDGEYRSLHRGLCYRAGSGAGSLNRGATVPHSGAWKGMGVVAENARDDFEQA